MNDVLKTIAERNSCRNFSPAPISDQQVHELVTAALASPSGMNRQPWHIIAITDKSLIDEMDKYVMEGMKTQNEEAYKRMMDRGGKIFYDAPCFIVIAKEDGDYAAIDCGIVSQNISLAAHSLGLGSVICGMARMVFSGERGDEFKKRIKMPEGYTFGLSVCVGAAISGKDPHELNFDKVTYIK